MEELKRLWQQVAQQKIVQAKYHELQSQRGEVASRLKELEKTKAEEQADVDRLEKGGLAAFFYQMAGRMEEKLDKERQEAYAARVRYDAAARELSALDRELGRMEAQLKELSGCDRRYQEALVARMQEIKATNSPAAQELVESETRVMAMKLRQKEIREAVQAGHTALETARQMQESLDDAEGWSTIDLMGGSVLSDLAKYEHLDQAQELAERLQMELRRFKTELADVEINPEMQVTVDGFLRFADFFFDNFFTDWAGWDHIVQAQKQVQKTQSQIRRLLDKLDRMDSALKAQLEDECEKQEQIARSAEL